MNCLKCNIGMRVNPITREVQARDAMFFRECHFCGKCVGGYCRQCNERRKVKVINGKQDKNSNGERWERNLEFKLANHIKEWHTPVDLV